MHRNYHLLKILLSVCFVALSWLHPAWAQDDCATATLITVGTPQSFTPVDGATGFSGFSTGCAAVTGAFRDSWRTFTVTRPQLVRIEFLNGLAQDIALAAWSGACGTLTNLGCVNNAGAIPGTTEAISFNAQVGVTYYIQVANLTANTNMDGALSISNQFQIGSTSVAVGACGLAFDIPTGINPLLSVDPTCFIPTLPTTERWARFRATATTQVRLRYTNTTQNANIIVYGSNGNPVVGGCVATTVIGTEEVRFPVITGQEYYIRLINPANNNAVSGSICLENIAPELCTNAITIPDLGCANNFYVFGTGVSNASSCLSPAAAQDGWAQFTASQAGTYTVTFNNNNEDAGLAIYSACVTPIGGSCVNATVGTGLETVIFVATAGTTYRIRVSNMNNTNLMTGTLCVYPDSSIATTVNTPACNAELMINLNDAIVDCGIAFTVLAGPLDAVAYPTSCPTIGSAFREGWASFVAPFTGAVTVQFNNFSPMDATIIITRDDGVNCTNGTLIQCANSIVGTGFGTESATINAIGGVKYFIRIVNTTSNTQPMPGELCVTTGTAPNADLCTNAQPVSIGTCSYPFNIPSDAFNNQNVALPASCPVTVFRDAWVSFPVVAGQTFIAKYNSQDSDAALALYRGTCASLTPLACSNNINDIGEEILTFSPNFTGTMYLRVMKVDEAGPMTGTLCISEMIARDECADALSSPTYLQTGDCDIDFNVASTFSSTPGDAVTCASGASPDAWVAYTADFTGNINVNYSSTNGVGPEMVFYESNFACGNAPTPLPGSCLANATLLPYATLLNLPVVINTTYLIKIISRNGADMNGRICLSRSAFAPSDNFAFAPTYVAGTNCGEQFNLLPTFNSSGNAPLGLGDPTVLSCAPGLPSLSDGWAQFVAPSNGTFVIEYDNRGNDPSQINDVAVLVYEGNTITLVNATAGTGFVENLVTSVTTPLVLNSTYTNININNTGVDGPGNSPPLGGPFSGDSWANFTVPAGPDRNITFVMNSPQSVGLVVYRDNGLFDTFFQSDDFQAVSLGIGRYTLAPGNYKLHILNAGLGPVTGMSFTAYSEITQRACANTLSDIPGIERISTTFTAGRTYYVRVANIENAARTTSGTLCIRDGVVPQGDLCDNPVSMLVGDCDRTFNITSAFVNDQPIPNPICLQGSGYNLYKDGWITFTATSNRTTIQYQSPSTDNTSMLAVYRGSCISPFLIGCTNPGTALEANRVRTLRVNTIPGLEYKLRIMSVGLSPTPTAAQEDMDGKVCFFNTVESDVCNDADLVTLNVNDCNIRFDVPKEFSLAGVNFRNFTSGTLPLLVTTGSLDQNIESSCETESPFTALDTNVQPVVGNARDAWVRMNGTGGPVTLTYQNNESGTLTGDGSNPAILVYTALADVGPVNCGSGSNGAGNTLNQYACANNITTIGKQTESVTFIANAGQRYIIRILDMDGGGNDMTGTLCISDGIQNYNTCATARPLEVGDCSIPLNVVQGRNTCYVPATNPGSYPNIATAPCSVAGLGADGCGGGSADAWATFRVDASLLPSGNLPQTNGTQTDVTIEYDNRNYTFDVAADAALFIYRVTDCTSGTGFTLVACSDALGAGVEGVEKVLIPNVTNNDVFHIRVINRSTGQSLFGKICSYYGVDVADESCPTTQSYGELSGEFRSFTVGNTGGFLNTSLPSSSITNPPCVVPGGSNPTTRSTDPIRAHGWISFTVPVTGLPPTDPGFVSAVTVQYDNTGFASGTNVQNAAVAVYTVNNANPLTPLLTCQLANSVADNRILLVDCVDTVFEGAESVTIGVQEGRTYYVRVMNIANADSPGVMPGRIRIFPYAPCRVGDELVVDGGFEGWPAIDPNGEAEANNVTNADFARRLNDIMVTPCVTTTSAYPSRLDTWAKYATDYGFLRDRTNGDATQNNGTLPNANGITDSTATYARFIARQGELNPEGLYLVKQSPWSVKDDWYSFGNGYSGYGGRTGGGTPVTSYCLTGAGAGGEPCVEITRNFANGPENTEGIFNTTLGIPRPFPYTSDANFMIVNGSFDPASGLPPGKVWCQTIRRNGATVGYYVFTIWVQNMISGGRNLDVPQLRLTVCDMADPITGVLPITRLVSSASNAAGIESILPGISIYDPVVKPYTIHSPTPPINRLRDPRVAFSYGAARPCNSPSEARDARLKVLGSSFLIDERPDAWQVIRCIYKAPMGVEAMNICIENLSITKNGNDFAIDDISFRECLNPDQEAFERLLRGDPCELADSPDALDIPLSVTMLDFSGNLVGDRVFLNWITLRENNAGYFEVQRSVDGANFSPIGEVLAKGSTSTLNSYDFVDTQLPKDVEYLYYRLKIYNDDGTSKMGPLVRINVSGLNTFDLEIFPNPISQGDNVKLRFNVAEGQVGLAVADMMGNVLQQSILSTINGLNDVTLNTSKLAPGIYIIQVRQNGQKVAKRLVVY